MAARDSDRAGGEGTACPGRMEIPTARECVALGQLRGIKVRVRELKQNLLSAGAEKGSDKAAEIEKSLDSLRKEWNRWEKERKAAARERMVLLGHEDAW